MTALEIVQKYIAFFTKRGHKRIPNAPLVPENDPTTLFTSSGMQSLVPYLLGESHPQGKRLVNVQNCFRAQDIDEVGDNRHTTFFRMLGNWSLGDYFKSEQLVWFFEFLTKELRIPPQKLYISVFQGFNDIPKDNEATDIWKKLFEDAGIDPKNRIFFYGVDKNWWSRSGLPQDMPGGEPGGPDTEVFFDFGTPHDKKYGDHCHINCPCGRYLEIGNSVFMQYQKQNDGSFKELSQRNVDFGGGLERLLTTVENKQDIFQTTLFIPIIRTVELTTGKSYNTNAQSMRVIADHFVASVFIAANNVVPSNKEHGYVLRRLIRRGLDNFNKLGGTNMSPILESIVEQYKMTDPYLVEKFETINNLLFEEQQKYFLSLKSAKNFISQKYHVEKVGDELKGITRISSEDAFALYTTHGLSPTQIKSMGYEFDARSFAEKMKKHREISRKGASQKFAGGLSDTSRKTVMGHTATHLLHQAIRDALGKNVHQTGSNITQKRIRFDFNYDKKLTDQTIKKIEGIVNEKIKQHLKVYFEMMPLAKAKEIGAIGLFDEKYQDMVKVYFIGFSTNAKKAYSKEFCGGPHVDFTDDIKRFKIIKQESIGKEHKRLYAVVR